MLVSNSVVKVSNIVLFRTLFHLPSSRLCRFYDIGSNNMTLLGQETKQEVLAGFKLRTPSMRVTRLLPYRHCSSTVVNFKTTTNVQCSQDVVRATTRVKFTPYQIEPCWVFYCKTVASPHAVNTEQEIFVVVKVPRKLVTRYLVRRK